MTDKHKRHLKLLLSVAYSIGYFWIPGALLLGMFATGVFLTSADDVDADVFLAALAVVLLADDNGRLCVALVFPLLEFAHVSWLLLEVNMSGDCRCVVAEIDGRWSSLSSSWTSLSVSDATSTSSQIILSPKITMGRGGTTLVALRLY